MTPPAALNGSQLSNNWMRAPIAEAGPKVLCWALSRLAGRPTTRHWMDQLCSCAPRLWPAAQAQSRLATDLAQSTIINQHAVSSKGHSLSSRLLQINVINLSQYLTELHQARQEFNGSEISTLIHPSAAGTPKKCWDCLQDSC